MIGSKFKADSGVDHEWFVFKSHGLFSDVWYCYPTKRYEKDKVMKDNFIQCFDTQFIKQNKIYEKENGPLFR